MAKHKIIRKKKLLSPKLYVGAAAVALTLVGSGAYIARAATAPVLYVDKNNTACSNTGSGTATQPFCTIAKAASVAVAGQTVVVAAGTYAENVTPGKSGTSGSPITYTAAPGAVVTVTGTPAGSNGFSINGKSYITIKNFTIDNTVGHGISVPSASANLIISGNHISHAGRSTSSSTLKRGISLAAATNSIVTGNTIDYNTGTGVYVAAGSNGNTIDRNSISYNATRYFNSSGVYQRLAPGIDIRSNNNIISGNVSHHNDDSGIQVWSGATGNLVVNNSTFNNIGYPNSQAGDHGIDISNAPGNRVIGNTVYNNRTAGINVEGTSTGTTIANNIAVDNGLSGGRTGGNIRVTSTSVSGTTSDYNLVYNTSGSGTVVVWNSTGYSSLTSLRKTGQEAHGLQADPIWVSADTGDFHLTAASPAIDSANSGVAGQAATDLEGIARRDDASVVNTGVGPRAYDDRGAYEF